MAMVGYMPISGPDWTDMPPFEEEKVGFSEYFGAIDIHSYHGVGEEGEENLRRWATWAHSSGKPFFLTEYGNMNLGWGGDDPNQKSFDAAISNACDVLHGFRAGVDGFNRWSFTNRGDLDAFLETGSPARRPMDRAWFTALQALRAPELVLEATQLRVAGDVATVTIKMTVEHAPNWPLKRTETVWLPVRLAQRSTSLRD